MGTRIYDSAGNLKEEVITGAVGQKVVAESASVVIASDQPPISVISNPAVLPTYRVLAIVGASTVGNNLTIRGSATKIIRISHAHIAQVVSNTLKGELLLRSRILSASTPGTTVLPVSLDTTNVVSSVTASFNATLPTVIGNIHSAGLRVDNGGKIRDGSVDFDFAGNSSQHVTLRGLSEYFQINIEALFEAPTGGSIEIMVEFTEE